MFQKNVVVQLTILFLSLSITMQAEDRATCSNATLHGRASSSLPRTCSGDMYATVPRVVTKVMADWHLPWHFGNLAPRAQGK